jgi:hypothetical protein
MHMKYIHPQFGSIVCLSPELDSKLYQARQAKKAGTRKDRYIEKLPKASYP